MVTPSAAGIGYFRSDADSDALAPYATGSAAPSRSGMPSAARPTAAPAHFRNDRLQSLEFMRLHILSSATPASVVSVHNAMLNAAVHRSGRHADVFPLLARRSLHVSAAPFTTKSAISAIFTQNTRDAQ